MHPTNGPITQPFGANPQFSWQLGYGHLGVDYGVPQGTPVVSIAPGTVLWADWGQNMPYGFAVENAFIPGSGNSGICVVIQHDGWRSISAHLSSTHLNPGDRVGRGQEVGKSGTTGNSTGPHLHYETYVTGNPSSPPFGRYNALDQIAHEDRVGGGSTPPPAAPPASLPADHRRVGPGVVNQRSKPSTGSPVVRTIQPKTVEVFTKWTRGERVDVGGFVSDIWYGDDAGWAWAGGFETQTGEGLTEQRNALPGDHRQMGSSSANQRSAPNTNAPVVRTIPGGSVEKFTHFTRGQSLTVGGLTSDIWYKDSVGFVWSGAFETQTGEGLAEFKLDGTAGLKPNQRLVGAQNANQRSAPKTAANVVRTVPGGTIETFTHWTKGDTVTIGGLTSDLWYKDDLGYVWAGAFEVQSKDGLPEHVYNPAAVPPKSYQVTAFDSIVTEVRPARPGKFEAGNFPGLSVPNVYIHQFNADEPTTNAVTNKNTVHIDSVINTFTAGERVASAHFAVEGTRIVQFLNLSDRAYAQGPGNGDGISIETYGGQDPVTMATVAKLINRLEEKKGGKFNLLRHKDVMATLCGTGVNLVTYRNMVDALKVPTPPVVVVPPVVVPPVVVETAEAVLAKVRDMVNNWFNRK